MIFTELKGRHLCTSGFSLVEMMVVISIAAILLAIGVPSFQTLLRNQRMTVTVNDFFSAINLTRAHAIGIGKRVDLGPTDGTSWDNGWTVFVNVANDTNNLYNAGDEIITTHGEVPSDIKITSNLSDNATKYIAYASSGRTRINSNSQSIQSGTITFTQGTEIRCIGLNFLGRPQVYKPAAGVTTCTVL